MAERVNHSPRNPESFWQKGFPMYQCYTQSFKDTNGDGFGDLNGVREKLPYLHDLGIKSIWLNPIFLTDFADGGYDVKNYKKIDPKFGDKKIYNQMVKEIHGAGMQIVLDLVLNHTSNKHPWFIESRSSRDNPKRHWYIWRDPKPDGSPPNNWPGDFGGSAWTRDRKTSQAYLHTFLPEQPDLNYENDEVIKAMGDVLRYYFENMKAGAVRLDAIPFVRKAEGLPDDAVNHAYKKEDHPNTRTSRKNMQFQPGMMDALKYFSDIATKYTDKFLISESWDESWWKKVYRATPPGIHAPFNAQPINLPWDPKAHTNFFTNFYNHLRPGDVAITTFDSHDVYKRIATWGGDDQAPNVAMLNLTLPGIPVIYYGDEIGMKNWPVDPKSQTNPFARFDPETKRTKESSRLPMPWNDGPNAGFTTGTPWLPIPQDYKERNVEAQLTQSNSILNLHKALIAHREQSIQLREGAYFPIGTGNKDVYGHQCQTGRKKEIVLLNFTDKRQKIYLDLPGAKVILKTDLTQKKDEKINLFDHEMRPNEGIIVSLNS